MTYPTQSPVHRYGLALLAVAVALGVSLAIRGVIVETPGVLLFAAVLVTGWYARLGPAIAAAVLASLALDYFMIEPRFRFDVTPFGIARTALFGLVAAASAALGDMRRRSEELAVNSQEMLTVTLASIGDAVLAADAEGRVSFMNDVAAGLTGWDRTEAAGQPLDEVFRIINEETRAPQTSPFHEVISTGRIVGLANHTVLIARDGREVPIEDSGAPIRGTDGAIVGVVLVFRDDSERRRAEREREELLASEQASRAEAELAQQRFEYLAMASQVLASSLDYERTLDSVVRMAVPRLADWAAIDMVVDGRIQRVAVAHIDPKKVEWGWELYRRFPPDPNAPNGVPAVIRTGRSEFMPEVTEEIIRASTDDPELLEAIEKIAFTSAMVVPIHVRDQVRGAITFVTAESKRRLDDSDLALAEDLARRASTAIEHAELYREIALQRRSLEVTLASIGDAVISTDAEGRIAFMNRVAESITGWAAADVAGQPLSEVFRIYDESTGEPVANPVEVVLRENRVVELGNGIVLVDRTGVEHPIDDSAAPILNDDGAIGGVVMTFRDVTERRRIELQVRSQRDQLDAILRGVSDGVTALTPDGRLIFANDAAAQASGFASAEEMVAANPREIVGRFELFDEHGAPLPVEMLPSRRALHGERSQLTMQFRYPGGDIRWATVHSAPVFDAAGNVQFAITIFHDISAIVVTERALRTRAAQQTAVAALGQRALAGADVQKLLDDAVETVARTLDLDLVKVLALEPDQSALVVVAGIGWEPGVVGSERVETGEHTQAGYTLARKRPVVTDDLSHETRFRGASILHRHGVVSGMTVTIGSEAEPFGILGVHTRERREFTSDDAHFLESVANIIASSVGRRRVEDRLALSEGRFRLLVEQSPLSIQIFNPEGYCIQANEAWEELWQADRSALEGYNILHDPQLEAKGILDSVRAAFQGFAGSTEPVRYDPHEIGKSGRARWVRSVIYPVVDERSHTREVVLVLEDVTERVVAEQRLQIQYTVSRLLAEAASIESVGLPLLEAIGTHLGSSYGALWLADRDGEELRAIETWMAPGADVRQLDERTRELRLRRGAGFPGRIWQRGSSLYVGRLEQTEAFPRQSGALELGLGSGFGFPILLGGGVQGVFEFFSAPNGGPAAEIVETMDALGRQIAQFVERRRAEDALRASEERYRTVAETASDAIFIVDTSSHIVFANRAAETVFGYAPDDLIGADLTMLMPDYLRIVHERAMARYVATGERTIDWTGVELPGLHRDGRTIPLEISYGEFVKDGARFFTGIVRDITDRKEFERELQQAKEQAEAASAAKDQFMAVLSHELRTPLTPVLTLVQFLESTQEPPEDMHSIFTMIRRNIELEARLIDDLLDLTRITRGKLHLDIEMVDAHALLRNVVDICSEDIAGKNQSLELALDATEHRVKADPARLQQVFWNLLQNAVKFTPDGGAIAVRSENPSPGAIEIDVADSGIGLEPEQIARVFNPFEQAEQSISRRFGGLGLGLSISRSIVEMHGGEIAAASGGINQGSTFSVRLATAGDGLEPSSASAPGGGSNGEESPRRILLVDDHLDTSSVMKLLLERRGYHVETAWDVSSAMNLVRSREYDLLISDIGLPDGSGLDLMRSVRELKPLAGIALSGFGMEEDIRRSHEAGFAEHLIKPVNFQALQEAINRVLS